MTNIFKAIFPRRIPKAKLRLVQGGMADDPKVLADFKHVCDKTGMSKDLRPDDAIAQVLESEDTSPDAMAALAKALGQTE